MSCSSFDSWHIILYQTTDDLIHSRGEDGIATFASGDGAGFTGVKMVLPAGSVEELPVASFGESLRDCFYGFDHME